MISKVFVAAILLAFSLSAAGQTAGLSMPGEKRLKNIKQLTNGGENAEAYFSFDGKKLIFQSKRDGRQCDQIYTMNIDGSDVKMVSTGKGRTTCSYFQKNGKKIVYGSTPPAVEARPPGPGFSPGVGLGNLSELRHLCCQCGRQQAKAADESPGLRCRGDDLAGRQEDRLYLDPRR